jgi:hypothetical protein
MEAHASVALTRVLIVIVSSPSEASVSTSRPIADDVDYGPAFLRL